MDDVKLDQALSGLRERLAHLTPPGPSRGAECLSFGRARLLALDPSRRTPEEDAHLAGCRRCPRMVAGFERELPHLPYWTLVRRHLFLLSPAEQQMVEYHLDTGGCRICQERYQRLQDGPLTLLRLPPPAAPEHPKAVLAAAPEPEVVASVQRDGLEADLVYDRGELALEVRTRRAELGGSLVTYTFADAGGAALSEGFVVLGPDVDGWYAAEVKLDPAHYREQVRERCRALWIGTVQPGALSDEEWQRVVEAAPAPDAEPDARSAWAAWCARSLLGGTTLSGAARGILEELSQRLR